MLAVLVGAATGSATLWLSLGQDRPSYTRRSRRTVQMFKSSGARQIEDEIELLRRRMAELEKLRSQSGDATLRRTRFAEQDAAEAEHDGHSVSRRRFVTYVMTGIG